MQYREGMLLVVPMGPEFWIPGPSLGSFQVVTRRSDLGELVAHHQAPPTQGSRAV